MQHWKAGRIVTIQTLGGPGALKVGADFLHRYFPESEVWVIILWDNHHAIFQGAGVNTHTYPTMMKKRVVFVLPICWKHSVRCH